MANEGRPSRPFYRSPSVILVLVLSIVAVAAIVYYAGRTEKPTFFHATVKTGNITSMVQATGVVNPIHTVAIGAQISGKILKINVDFNSVVKQGQLIAQIDPSVYQNSLDSAKADLASAQATEESSVAQVAVAQAAVATNNASVAKAQANVTMAKLQQDRTLGLFKDGIVAASQRDQDVATYQSDQADVASAQAGLAQSQAQLKAAQASVSQAKAVVLGKQSALQTAQTNLDYCNIYAPEDGVIIDRAVDVGQTVASSLQTPTLFSEATDLSTMWVYTQTDESDEGRLKDGDDATFTVDAYPNITYHGIVQQRRMFATTVQNVVEYDTIIQFQNTDLRIFPGMTAYVNIPVARATNVMEVPNSALRFKPSLTPVQLRDKLAEYGMQDTSATPAAGGTTATPAAGAAAPATDAAAPAAGGRAGSGGGGSAHAGRGGHGANSGDATGSGRPTNALIWKIDVATNELTPVRVRTGITDYTYTAITSVLQGSLKAGDEIVTGQLVVKSAASGLPGSTAPSGRGR